ncbi:jg8382 [Pararge aegeria aegeria]|uniref:Jg8382 protein n=1 Tax=Pararge aegeria aegeria TaxID=348720 RepID=A0A8S4SNT1_9NEOP|nr:jg8382 [Pararge aegeria aegeria]
MIGVTFDDLVVDSEDDGLTATPAVGAAPPSGLESVASLHEKLVPVQQDRAPSTTAYRKNWPLKEIFV